MKKIEEQLARLLRAAARVPNEPPAEMSLGFDTRVLAHWRAARRDSAALTRLLRRVMVLAAALIVLATAGAYRELAAETDSAGESLSDNDAIADSAIGVAFEE